MPGLDLEDFVAWNYDLVVEDSTDVNFSLGVAELLSTIPQRQRMTKEEFAKVLAPFEPYRERVENWLLDFDEDNQSWRDYAAYAPVQDVFEAGAILVRYVEQRA